MVRAVLFDMDGTVLDTERIYKICWEKAMNEENIAADENTFFDLVGLNDASTREYFREKFGFSDERYVYMRKKAESFAREYKLKNGTPVKKGFVALSDFLIENDIGAAIVTSTVREEALRSLSAAGIEKRFDLIIGGDDVISGKPSPEPYLRAVKALNLTADECIAAEDSANGVRSAYDAGIKCVYIPDMKDISSEIKRLAAYEADSLDKIIEIVSGLDRE